MEHIEADMYTNSEYPIDRVNPTKESYILEPISDAIWMPIVWWN